MMTDEDLLATIDAAKAEERELCARLVDTALESADYHSPQDYVHLAEQIRARPGRRAADVDAEQRRDEISLRDRLREMAMDIHYLGGLP
jgi:hypothetical protein